MTITPAQYSKTQRRFLTTLGGLGVAALAAGTFVLSYDDLRLLALRGGAARHWAFLYPWMLDGLVVVIILAILTARRSGWFTRTIRWLLLVLLIGGAGAAGVQRAVKGYAVLPDTPVNVGVAVAPWAILIIAVWLWVSMIKQVLSLRARRSRLSRREAAGAVEGVVEGTAEPVPAALADQSIIPGLGPGDTRRLPLASSVRELEPVRAPAPPVPDEPLPPPAPSEPEPNPWDAARVDTPQPWERDEPAAAPEPAVTVHPEPSDPVPASWLGEPDPTSEDDTQPIHAKASPTDPGEPEPAPWQDERDDPAEPDTREPEPLLPPARSHLEERPEERDEETAPASVESTPPPQAEIPMTDAPAEPAEEEPAHGLVARAFLPTDVRLVGPKPSLSDTNPDGIPLPDTNPDGIPLVPKARDAGDEGDEESDGYADERAEDPDAGDEGAPWENTEATPPSSKFRSGPTPPRG
jgi:hypothetical protein